MYEYPSLIQETSEALAWVDHVKSAYWGSKIFGKITSGVIWCDERGSDGKQLVPIDDPGALASDINTNGFPLLRGHDPGFPVGKVLRAEVFASPDGVTFIAA